MHQLRPIAQGGTPNRGSQGTPAKRGPKPRISDAVWIETALGMLAVGGVDALRVDALSARLEVTKGTFYSRFRSRDEFLELLLDHWRRISTDAVIAELSAIDEQPIARLARIFEISVSARAKERARIEAALRLWAYRDERPARVLLEIDQHRLKYFRSVVASSGVPPKGADGRAFLVYAYIIADAMLPGDRDDIRESCRSFLASGTSWNELTASLESN